MEAAAAAGAVAPAAARTAAAAARCCWLRAPRLRWRRGARCWPALGRTHVGMLEAPGKEAGAGAKPRPPRLYSMPM